MTVFKELIPKQYQSQFNLPENQDDHPPENQNDNQEDNMVQFRNNIPCFNHRGQATSPPQPTPYAVPLIKTPPFNCGVSELPYNSDLLSSATKVEVNMESEAFPMSSFKFNKNVNGIVCEYHHLAKLNSK